MWLGQRPITHGSGILQESLIGLQHKTWRTMPYPITPFCCSHPSWSLTWRLPPQEPIKTETRVLEQFFMFPKSKWKLQHLGLMKWNIHHLTKQVKLMTLLQIRPIMGLSYQASQYTQHVLTLGDRRDPALLLGQSCCSLLIIKLRAGQTKRVSKGSTVMPWLILKDKFVN